MLLRSVTFFGIERKEVKEEEEEEEEDALMILRQRWEEVWRN